MAKFQTKYSIQIDHDDAERKAQALGYAVRRGGGRPEKGQESPGAQVIITTPETIIQISSNTILVSWSGPYEKIREIEHALENMLELKRDHLKPLRMEVPSILLERERIRLIAEIMDKQEKIDQDFKSRLEEAFREGRVQDFLEREIARRRFILRTLGDEEKIREFEEGIRVLKNHGLLRCASRKNRT